MIKEKFLFIGTWKSISAKEHGSVTARYGEEPLAYLMYDGGGHMSVLGINSTREVWNPVPETGKETEAQKSAAFDTVGGYFGTYTVKEDMVIHHVEGGCHPNHRGTDQERRFKFSDDGLTLTLNTPTGEYIWERIWPRKEGVE